MIAMTCIMTMNWNQQKEGLIFIMSKFKVGDKVAPKGKPYLLFGQVLAELFEGWYTIMGQDGDWGIMPEDDLSLYEEIPDMTDDEIYAMLKPKMDKSNVWTYGYRVVGYRDGHRLVRADDDVVKAIALAYRSGYLRAKKGRPFKIGEDKCE